MSVQEGDTAPDFEMPASGGRTVTGLTLQSTGPGTWDTDGGTADWALGVAATLNGTLLNNPTTAAVNFAVPNGGTFVLFASDYAGIEFVSGATLTVKVCRSVLTLARLTPSSISWSRSTSSRCSCSMPASMRARSSRSLIRRPSRWASWLMSVA